MLRTKLGPRHFYRCLTPKWAYLPLSGAGAASAGGRFNRPGVEALYLSAEPDTALAEYKQGSSLPRPATLAAYELDLGDVVDLTAGYDQDNWAAPWADWNGDWRWIARVEHKVPPSCSSATRRSGRVPPVCCFHRRFRLAARTSWCSAPT